MYCDGELSPYKKGEKFYFRINSEGVPYDNIKTTENLEYDIINGLESYYETFNTEGKKLCCTTENITMTPSSIWILFHDSVKFEDEDIKEYLTEILILIVESRRRRFLQ